MKSENYLAQTSTTSPLGRLVLAASSSGLAGVWFDDQSDQPDLSACPLVPNHPVLQAAIAQLAQYFAGQRHSFDVPLDLSAGSAFQQSVWQALLTLPFGQTCSYGALSNTIGQPKAVRAVGAAIGRNPVSVIVPCHRVIGANGSLTGYSGGLHRKTALLKLEGGL